MDPTTCMFQQEMNLRFGQIAHFGVSQCGGPFRVFQGNDTNVLDEHTASTFSFELICEAARCRDSDSTVRIFTMKFSNVMRIAKYSVILSVLDSRKCEYLNDYSLDFVHAYMTTYLAS